MEIAVVRVGVAGTAAALYLARDSGMRVALYDCNAVGSVTGESFGDSQLYRETYSDPFYSGLMRSELTLWREDV